MPRPRKPVYEYVESRNEYRKRLRGPDGKYIALYARTPDELTEKIAVVREEIAEEIYQRDNPTVKEYAEKWLELVTAGMTTKNKETYKSAIALHVLPLLGDKYLCDVQPDDARLVLSALAGRSASLQGKVLCVMRKMFENAVDNDLIRKNPCAALKNTGYKTKEKTALTKEQTAVLLDAVRGTRAEPFVMLGVYTGMRREEILALQWDCVFLPKKGAPYVVVRRALRWVKCRPEVTEILKSDAARRTIPIPPQLAGYLNDIRKESGYVVGGTPLSQTQFKNLWRIVTNRCVGEKTYKVPYSQTKEKATFIREKGAKSRGGDFHYTIDFPVSPHILRHTYITNLIMSGVDLKAVQYLAGHADIKVTLNIYTHLIDRSPDRLQAEISKAFEVHFEVHPD